MVTERVLGLNSRDLILMVTTVSWASVAGARLTGVAPREMPSPRGRNTIRLRVRIQPQRTLNECKASVIMKALYRLGILTRNE